jgi:adenylate kinase family enzyme
MKISVVGNSGSGKSTAARKIAKRFAIPRLELDSLRHQPDWQELPDDEFRHAVREFIASHDEWVVDGNYRSVVQADVWAAADTVVWLDLPLLQNMRNIIWRTVSRAVLRTELWNGNRERWQNLFSLDPYESMIVWAWTRHGEYRERYEASRDDPRWSHLDFVRLTSREALDAWLETHI